MGLGSMDKKAWECRCIEQGETFLGIELGSTRIKSVLLDGEYKPLASGSFTWENQLRDGHWTYSLEDAERGLQASYADLAGNVLSTFGIPLRTVGAIGISGMMHGYLPLDAEGKQLYPFLTWRNTNAAAAAEELTKLFAFNVPIRWSISQLYQAMLNGEEHVTKLAYLTTLAGYFHWRLSREKVLGIGDASGMFPIDSETNDYHSGMLEQFRRLPAPSRMPWDIGSILPKVLTAGQPAGVLTPEGARLLDVSGTLRPGIPMAPPEGDAGTGMAATNSVAVRTGNVSAGTSIFSMVVLEKKLSKVYPEIDMVTTPTGKPVAMVHCNNCSTYLNEWMHLFRELTGAVGQPTDLSELFSRLFQKSLEGDTDCGGIIVNNYQSGEPITALSNGCPFVLSLPGSSFTLANFMRAHIYSTIATLAIGMKILEKERVVIDRINGHGGLFKTPGVTQKFMADALKTTVSVMETAGEGGPFGMALLASYMVKKEPGETLEAFLEHRVFARAPRSEQAADPEGIAGFELFLDTYIKTLRVERAAAELAMD